jgi:hypothetical protein
MKWELLEELIELVGFYFKYAKRANEVLGIGFYGIMTGEKVIPDGRMDRMDMIC